VFLRKKRNTYLFCNTPFSLPVVSSCDRNAGRAIRILLSHGIGSWLSSANIQFPSELLALAYSKQRQAFLEGFNFFKVQNADTMPDRVPLFGLQLHDKQHLISFLKDKGIVIGH
jgi:hypothetical protein